MTVLSLKRNVVRHVRTPEGAEKYGQPIGSVIIIDPDGNVVDVRKPAGQGDAPDAKPRVEAAPEDLDGFFREGLPGFGDAYGQEHVPLHEHEAANAWGDAARSAKRQVVADLTSRMEHVPDEQMLDTDVVRKLQRMRDGHSVLVRRPTGSDLDSPDDPFGRRWDYREVNRERWDAVGGLDASDLPEGLEVVDPEQYANWERAESVNRMIALWASTSNGASIHAWLMQDLAEEEFGLTNVMPWLYETHPDSEQEARRPALRESHGERFRQFLRAQYAATQERFREEGITDVRLYRGVRLEPGIDQEWNADGDHEIPMRPMSSFTTEEHVAALFADSTTSDGWIIEGVVPVERILGTPRTGVGCLREAEMVVLSGEGQWRVRRMDPAEHWPEAVTETPEEIDPTAPRNPLLDDDLETVDGDGPPATAARMTSTSGEEVYVDNVDPVLGRAVVYDAGGDHLGDLQAATDDPANDAFQMLDADGEPMGDPAPIADTLDRILETVREPATADEPAAGAVIDSTNPSTHGVFEDYASGREFRATAPLAPNMTTLAETEGVDPDAEVTLYRGVPTDAVDQGIVPGDFVTTNRMLARDYAGNGRVVSMQARYGDVLDDRDEPGGEEYIYRPATEAGADPTADIDPGLLTSPEDLDAEVLAARGEGAPAAADAPDTATAATDIDLRPGAVYSGDRDILEVVDGSDPEAVEVFDMNSGKRSTIRAADLPEGRAYYAPPEDKPEPKPARDTHEVPEPNPEWEARVAETVSLADKPFATDLRENPLSQTHSYEFMHDGLKGMMEERAVVAKRDVAARVAARLADVPDDVLLPAGRVDWYPRLATLPADTPVVRGEGGSQGIHYRPLDAWEIARIEKGEAHDTTRVTTAGDPGVRTHAREAAVSVLVSKWATTSNDHDAESLALQQVAADLFDLGDVHEWTAVGQSSIDDKIEKHGTAYRAFLRAQYDETQEQLAAAGMDTVTLYRGVRLDTRPAWAEGIADHVTGDREIDLDWEAGEPLGDTEVPLRPLSSFTSTPATAAMFAENANTSEGGDYSYVMAATIPRERILSTPRTGFGCLNETEYVVLGGNLPARVWDPQDLADPGYDEEADLYEFEGDEEPFDDEEDVAAAAPGGPGTINLETTDHEGRVGDRSHITRNQRGTIPLSLIATMPGEEGEVPGEHRNRQDERWDEFVDDIRQNGIRDPIFIIVDPGKEPRISEGNHRRDAAVEAGLTDVPVQIRYFGHSEYDHPVESWSDIPAGQQDEGPAAEPAAPDGEGGIEEYGGGHQPPDPDSAASIDDLANPETGFADVYEHPEWYGHGSGEEWERETYRVIRSVRGKPDAMVTIYRAAPEGVTHFDSGNWVALAEGYTRQHAMHPDDPEKDMPVYAVTVPAHTLHHGGNDVIEYGYWGPRVPVTVVPRKDTA